MFDLNLFSYIYQLLPPNLKQPKNFAIIFTLLKPLQLLLLRLSEYRSSSKLEITATAQIVVLEYNLCRIIGLPTGYIYIANSVNSDFAVLIPNTLTSVEEEIVKRYVLAHKLVGKSFEIIRNI